MQKITKRRHEMKGRLIAFVCIFCLAVLTVSGQVAQGKPDKPPVKSNTEWIEFWGDLNGGQPVDGCCPNAGPWPPYRMCLNFEVSGHPAGTRYDGHLFINGYRYHGWGEREYIVQFWTDDQDVAIEIIGGVVDFDKRTKVLTVTFTDELCVDMGTGQPITTVTFTLIRRPY
jgi:hypothetical protein